MLFTKFGKVLENVIFRMLVFSRNISSMMNIVGPPKIGRKNNDINSQIKVTHILINSNKSKAVKTE